MAPKTRGGGTSPKKLKFSDKLIGKGLATDALLKKLKALHTELAEFDQERVDVNSLGAVRKELVSTSILLHKDKGVKAYAACCLADLLRLYAPDAPYTAAELRDIFQFFFRQLSTGLKGSDSPYYNEYFHLLESLSTVKSVVLVCDLPNADELMVDIFRDFFGLIRHDLAKNIEMFMADILVALIDECQSLPSDVLEAIMAQFMDKNARMEQPAYRLAVEVCNATANKLQRHVCQYFTDIIVQHSRDEEFDEIRAAHDLIKQLNRSCPSLLHNVVPQLEEELRVEEVQLRLMATQVLGEMFADVKGGADLVKKYPQTWTAWLMRKNDKSPAVRLAFVEETKELLVHVPELRTAIEEALEKKLLDPDEKVRAAVCEVYSQLDYETALHHVSEKQLRHVAGRGLDKKHHVRQEALQCMGKLYSLAYPEIENNDPAAIQQFAWIPQTVIPMVAMTSEVRPLVEQVVADYFLPLPKKGDDEVAWTDRLLTIMKCMDDKAINSLLSITGLKLGRPTPYERYLESCVSNNGGIIDENEETVKRTLSLIIQRLAGQFPDPHKSAEDLQTFAKMNENRLYQLLKTCTDTQTDLKGLVKATTEFLRRVEQSSSAILPTMTVFLRRASLRIVNQSSIPTLVKRIQKGPADFGNGNVANNGAVGAKNAQILLNHVSKYCPALHKPHTSEFSKAIADDKSPILVEVCLQALAAMSRWDDKVLPNDKRTTERVMRYVLESNHRQSKFAARILAYSRNREELCLKAVGSITEALSDVTQEQLVAHVAALVVFARVAPDAFEQQSDVIMAFLLKQVLMIPSAKDPDLMDTDAEWVETGDLSDNLRAKILSLKVCRHRCLAHASSDTALEIATPVLRMFISLLENGGSFTAEADDDPTVKTRLRLQAAVSLLHLSTVEVYANAIVPHFALLALAIQDPCYQVREIFLTKLITLVSTGKLHPRFNLIPFLTAHDPENDIKQKAKSYAMGAFQKSSSAVKVDKFEMIFIRLLHLLAHHPDFAVTLEGLQDTAKYIDLYFNAIASAENVSLIYHLAMKAKSVRDPESHQFSENLYVISELAQELIKARARARSWNLESYPGKVKLPSDIFRALPNAEEANRILKTAYLPEETVTWLGELSKSVRPSNPKDKTRLPRKAPAKRKATSNANGTAKRSRLAKRRAEDESDDEEDQSQGSASDEEDPKSAPEKSEEGSAESSHESGDEEKLGRGARTRAKARSKKQAKRLTKVKTD